jgi:16S rRNA (guanine527-N7)-methyltransferase
LNARRQECAVVVPTNFDAKLSARAALAGVAFTPEHIAHFRRYYELLGRWNSRMNLTALPLDDFPDATVDRLFIEPGLACPHLPEGSRWCDVGSGGGSPAVPLKILRPGTSLVMVEARARKAAFLRETSRTLGLSDTVVLSERFSRDNVPAGAPFDVITCRAVRIDADVWAAVARALSDHGQVLLFATAGAAEVPSTFQATETKALLGRGRLIVARRR